MYGFESLLRVFRVNKGMIVDNVIESLPSKVSPAALAAGAPEGLRVGNSSVGFDLVEMYASEATETTRISKIRAMAENLTCEQFKASCKDAQKRASDIDTAAGFKAAEGAKGQDQYGPVRRVLNQRLSEAKNLFGVFKLSAAVLAEKGYHPALKAARDFLKAQGKQWDGTKAPTQEEKQAEETKAMQLSAIQAAMQAHPREEGESMADWMIRCEEEVTSIEEKLQADAFNKGVNKAHEKIVKQYGTDMLLAVLQKTVDEMDTEGLEALQSYIQEELVIRQVENT
jgi:hypothetical protein